MTVLTPRQTEFLDQFLISYQRAGRPLHYTELADELNLGKVTVYEKLRLLEERGYVKSEYHLPEGDRGPGRSTVNFLPTEKALGSEYSRTRDNEETEAWEETTAEILHRLENNQENSYETFLGELLNRLSHQKSPLVYLTEVSTAIVLALDSVRDRAEQIKPLDQLGKLGLPGEIDLSALPGIGISLALLERVNDRASTYLAEQSGKFHATLKTMDEEKQRLVSEFTRRVTKIVYDQ